MKTVEDSSASLETVLGERERTLESHRVILSHRHQCPLPQGSLQRGRRLHRRSSLRPCHLDESGRTQSSLQHIVQSKSKHFGLRSERQTNPCLTEGDCLFSVRIDRYECILRNLYTDTLKFISIFFQAPAESGFFKIADSGEFYDYTSAEEMASGIKIAVGLFSRPLGSLGDESIWANVALAYSPICC